MKHHEVVLDLNRRGLLTFVRGMLAKVRDDQRVAIPSTSITKSEPYKLDTSIKVTADEAGGVMVEKKRLRASR